MTKVWISDDEWYPVPYYETDGTYGWECEVPQDILDAYDRAQKAFVEACNKLDSYRSRRNDHPD